MNLCSGTLALPLSGLETGEITNLRGRQLHCFFSFIGCTSRPEINQWVSHAIDSPSHSIINTDEAQMSCQPCQEGVTGIYNIFQHELSHWCSGNADPSQSILNFLMENGIITREDRRDILYSQRPRNVQVYRFENTRYRAGGVARHVELETTGTGGRFDNDPSSDEENSILDDVTTSSSGRREQRHHH
jgi:hypothetical protein